MEQELWDVVVVGGGAAGLSAALVLSRARRRVLVLDGGEPRNRFAEHMHGVLGRDGTSPLRLVADGRAEVEGYGGVVRSHRVETVDREGDAFVVDGSIRARRLIVATGLTDELPAIDGIAEHWGASVVSCPYCDGYEARDLRIAAMSAHQALMLRQWSSSVTLFGVVPDAEWRARLEAVGVAIDERPIERVLGTREDFGGIEVGGEIIAVDRLFAAGAFRPNDALLRQLGAEFADAPMGQTAVVGAAGATSLPGLWSIGNVTTLNALVPVAMGQGVAAATEVNFGLTMEDADRAVAARG